MPRLYVCCDDPHCPDRRNLFLKLQVYGIDTTPQRERGRAYIDVVIPDNWKQRRYERFAEMVRLLPPAHHNP